VHRERVPRKDPRMDRVRLFVLALVLAIGGARSTLAEAPYVVKQVGSQLLDGYRQRAWVNGILFFSASDGTYDEELWKSDGTSAGTVRVKDIYPGSWGSGPRQLTCAKGTLFFVAEVPGDKQQLWKSDGTEAGTVIVRDITPDGHWSWSPNGLTDVNGTLFFTANDGLGYALWKSDGTEEGTIKVKDVPVRASSLTNVNGTLFFVVDDGLGGRALWKSDGSSGGTVLVKSIGPDHFVDYLTNVEGTLFFVDILWWELWRSDGTEAGTRLVAPLPEEIKFQPVSVNGTLFFTVYGDPTPTGELPPALWKSDGTAKGTGLLKNVSPEWPGHQSLGSPYIDVNGTLFFVADGDGKGEELWKSDGTEAGTVIVKDIVPGPGGSFPGPLVNVNGTLFFPADDDAHGRELWRSDGTESGTVLVADLHTVLNWTFPLGLVAGGPGLFFTANATPEPGPELWALGVPIVKNDDGVAIVSPLGVVRYTITIDNPGINAFSAASVSDTFPAGLEGVTWTCTPTGLAACTPSGNGNINDTVWLPGGTRLTYVATGTLSLGASATLSNTVTITLAGDTAGYSATDVDVVATAMGYYTIAPCRLFDSRGAGGVTGGPSALRGQEARSLTARGRCGVPDTARAIAANVTAIGAEATGHIRVFPAGQALPETSTLNYQAGQTRGSNAIIALDSKGRFATYVGQPAGTTVDLVVDVVGYFEKATVREPLPLSSKSRRS
jgi:uncharacterized repeat protein (TIGR01451 family)